MKRILLASLAVAALSAALADEWLQVAEIKLEPPDGGSQVVTARLTPARTATYDLLEFECVYRQEIPWRDARGVMLIKTNEPVTFTYRRQAAKLTQDLDFYCSFRAPIALDKLRANYGERTFSDGVPVHIDRLRIRALVNQAPLWTHEFPTSGTHKVAAALPPPPPKRAPPGSRFGSVDLD